MYCFDFETNYQLRLITNVSGFQQDDNGITLPPPLRNPPTNKTSVVLALVRWLSPHPDAQLRDSQQRPVAFVVMRCPKVVVVEW